MSVNEEKTQITTDNSYIEDVVRGIKNKKYKSLVYQELECHLYDRIHYYKELGYDEDTATVKATEDMGDPEEASIPLNTLHSQKWYKQPLNIVVIAVVMVQIVLSGMFPNELRYFFSTHFIYKDFISLFVFVFNSLTVYVGYKNRSKVILVAQGLNSIFQIFFNPYRPMFYAGIKIFSSGFKNYIYSIFSYEIVNGSITGKMNAFSLSVSLVMFALVLIFMIALYRSERGKVNRAERKLLGKIYDISQKVISVFIICTMIVMSVSVAIAYTKRYEIIDTNKNTKGEIVRFVLNTDLERKNLEKITDEIKDYCEKSEYNYRYEKSADGSREFHINGFCFYLSDISQTFPEVEKNSISLVYTDTLNKKVLPETYKEFSCSENEFDFSEGMTIEDFCKTDLPEKISHFNVCNFDQANQIYLRMDNGVYKILDFEGNKCVDIYETDPIMPLGKEAIYGY